MLFAILRNVWYTYLDIVLQHIAIMVIEIRISERIYCLIFFFDNLTIPIAMNIVLN